MPNGTGSHCGIVHHARRHVEPVDFKTIQVKDCAIIHHRAEAQEFERGITAEVERGSKIIGVGAGRERGVFGSGQRRIFDEKQSRTARPRTVIITGCAPRSPEIGPGVIEAPEIRNVQQIGLGAGAEDGRKIDGTGTAPDL